jgi:hypothetical protein
MSNEEKIVNYPNSIDTRVALLEVSISTINQTLIRLESKMDKGFENLHFEIKNVREESKLGLKDLREELKSDIKDIRKEIQYNFRWLFTIIGTLSAIMAHGFRWF